MVYLNSTFYVKTLKVTKVQSLLHTLHRKLLSKYKYYVNFRMNLRKSFQSCNISSLNFDAGV